MAFANMTYLRPPEPPVDGPEVKYAIGTRVVMRGGGHGDGTIIKHREVRTKLRYLEEKPGEALRMAAAVGLGEAAAESLFYGAERYPYVVRWDPNAKFPRGYEDCYGNESLYPMTGGVELIHMPLERVIYFPRTLDRVAEAMDGLIGPKRSGTVLGYYNGDAVRWQEASLDSAGKLLAELCALSTEEIDPRILELIGGYNTPYIVEWDSGYRDLQPLDAVIRYKDPDRYPSAFHSYVHEAEKKYGRQAVGASVPA